MAEMKPIERARSMAPKLMPRRPSIFRPSITPCLFLNTFWTFSVAVACMPAIIKLYLGM
jgi:hypothetical protein